MPDREGPLRRMLSRTRESEDWRRRLGRFRGLDPDTRDRRQVEPMVEAPEDQQTHEPGFTRPDPGGE